LSLGKHYGDLSDGAFDITVSPLTKLWGFRGSSEPTVPPSEEAIQEQLKLVDYRRLVLADGTAFLPVKGMGVDLGGIAKGYAVDRAFDLCRSAGIRDLLIDLSGNIRANGRPHWREKWQIGVRDPFNRSRMIGRVSIQDGLALATSGSYERFIQVADTRYSHVINPKTGYPVTGTAGATIMARDATTADGLSTPYFIGGLTDAGTLLRKASAAEVLIVPDKHPTEIWLTPGFAKAFVPIPELAKAVRRLGRDSL
jgi:thiamine biosynthesis lipoprotein